MPNTQMNRRWLIVLLGSLAAAITRPTAVEELEPVPSPAKYEPISLQWLGLFPSMTTNGALQDVPADRQSLDGKRVAINRLHVGREFRRHGSGTV